jgi:acylphosphatase
MGRVQEIAMADTTEYERCEVIYQGRVQGVGFRYTTRHVAERFQVTGFVRNVPDGTVQLVVEGWPAEVQRFLAAVTAELGRYVAGSHATTSTATGEFAEFNIKM